jgi:hypothetical protein
VILESEFLESKFLESEFLESEFLESEFLKSVVLVVAYRHIATTTLIPMKWSQKSGLAIFSRTPSGDI